MERGLEWDMEIWNRHTEQGTEIHYVRFIQHMAIIGTEVSCFFLEQTFKSWNGSVSELK